MNPLLFGALLSLAASPKGSLLDDYLSLHDEALDQAAGTSPEQRKAALQTSDLRNGYLSGKGSNGDPFEVDLFITGNGKRVIAVAAQLFTKCEATLHFYWKNAQGEWEDCTATVLPPLDRAALEKAIPAEQPNPNAEQIDMCGPYLFWVLPRQGTTIVGRDHLSGAQLLELKWDRSSGKFSAQPTKFEKRGSP